MLTKIRSAWQWLSNLGVSEDLSSGEAKRIRLTNRITFVVGFLLIPSLVQYHALNIPLVFYIQTVTCILMITTPFWNHLKRFILARFILIGGGTVNVFLTSSVMGFESGEHTALVLVTLVAFILFDLRQKLYLGIGISLGFICWSVLEMTSHSVFGEFPITAQGQHESYIFNFTITLVFVSIIAYYFQGLSDRQVNDIVTRAQRELKRCSALPNAKTLSASSSMI